MTAALQGEEWSCVQRIGIHITVKHQPDNLTNKDSCNSANGFFTILMLLIVWSERETYK